MEYFSAIKKNEILSFAGKWMELELTMLSKINLTQEDKYITGFLSYAESSSGKQKQRHECK
jgi:hypothetical protein